MSSTIAPVKEHRLTVKQKELLKRLHSGDLLHTFLSVSGYSCFVTPTADDLFPCQNWWIRLNSHTIYTLKKHGYIELAHTWLRYADGPDSDVSVSLWWKISQKGIDKLIEERVV